MSDQSCLFVTTPIYYPNASPHIGSAYTTVMADILARFGRLSGKPVFFSTGTDEHGQKIAQAAEKAGVSPQEHVDHVSELFRKMVNAIDAQPDVFIRTTETRHHQAAQAFWKALVQRDQIYLGTYSGWYSLRDETFYTELELVDGKAPTGAPVTWSEEPCYFFRLSDWREALMAHYEAHPEAILPLTRRNEVLSLLKEEIPDLAISRKRSSCAWGIPVPEDSEHVMYVWVDALVNYLTVLGYPQPLSASSEALWSHVQHFLAKDILRFHAIHWPALLMAVGFQPPKRLNIHGWWVIDGEKLSKSLINSQNQSVDPFYLTQRYGSDALRYFMVRDMVFGQDANYDPERIPLRKQELAHTWGNLQHRVLSFIHAHRGGIVPKPGPLSPKDEELHKWSQSLIGILESEMEKVDFNGYLQHLYEGMVLGNQYIDQEAPWKLRKDPAQETRLNTVLFVLSTLLKTIAYGMQPITPQAASLALHQWGVDSSERSFVFLMHPSFPMTSLPTPTVLFPLDSH
jgi:methionyl-tRNA synthetase